MMAVLRADGRLIMRSLLQEIAVCTTACFSERKRADRTERLGCADAGESVNEIDLCNKCY